MACACKKNNSSNLSATRTVTKHSAPTPSSGSSARRIIRRELK